MRTFAGRAWQYRFRELDGAIDERACASVAARLLERYSTLTKAWTVELNSEWICRVHVRKARNGVDFTR
jgi:hypothetical protein